MKIRLRQEPNLPNKKPRSASAEKRKKIKKRRDHWLHLFQCKMGCEKCGYNENGYALIFAHRNHWKNIQPYIVMDLVVLE